MTQHYLSLKEFAERVGVKPDTLKGYRLPDPDATFGEQDRRGWLPETIDRWNAARPGRGWRRGLHA